MIFPFSIIALLARIPIIAFEVTDFPEPDSPTMQSVSPRFRSNEILRTAFRMPLSVLKLIARLFTDKTLSSAISYLSFPYPEKSLSLRFFRVSTLFASFQSRVKCVTQSVAEQIERNHHQCHDDSRENDQIRINAQILLVVGHHDTE